MFLISLLFPFLIERVMERSGKQSLLRGLYASQSQLFESVALRETCFKRTTEIARREHRAITGSGSGREQRSLTGKPTIFTGTTISIKGEPSHTREAIRLRAGADTREHFSQKHAEAVESLLYRLSVNVVFTPSPLLALSLRRACASRFSGAA